MLQESSFTFGKSPPDVETPSPTVTDAPPYSKILIFGSVPPPIGGVSVFIQRHSEVLRRAGVTVQIVDWRNTGVLARLRAFAGARSSDVGIEVHGYQTMPLLCCILLARGRSTLWLHSGQFSAHLTNLQRRILRASLGRLGTIVLVSRHIRGLLASNGFEVPADAVVEPAFIEPDRSRLQSIWESYPETAKVFVHQHKPVLVMQGADAFHEGADRYGTDIAIEALGLLRLDYPDAALLVGRPSVGSEDFQEYERGQRARINQLGLSESVFFLTGEQELWPMIGRADIFLRPTNQDGDSVSVREALALGVPVVASDACPRPEQCVSFVSRDPISLAEAIRTVLEGAEC
ncbi:MAG: glycosyltransferase family 4 protein [Bacteroidetes bacterium]|nr:glycosyltransferase family 4 protein [Bacteroidota bacterium]